MNKIITIRIYPGLISLTIISTVLVTQFSDRVLQTVTVTTKAVGSWHLAPSKISKHFYGW